jgi:carbon dioxide concentrating mechanism protein CcmK
MPAALGMIEVKGLPPALACADAMVKAARVTLVGYEKVSSMRYTPIVRGSVSEVKIAVEAGVEAMRKVYQGIDEDLLYSYHVIASPHANLDMVLEEIAYNDRTAQFRNF